MVVAQLEFQLAEPGLDAQLVQVDLAGTANCWTLVAQVSQKLVADENIKPGYEVSNVVGMLAAK
jgi:hypothetical protein